MSPAHVILRECTAPFEYSKLIENLTLLQMALAFGVILVGAYLNGAVGFGMGMMGAPLLVLVDPVFVPAPILLAGSIVTVFGIVRDWRALRLRGVGWAVAGRVPGSVLGAYLVALFSPTMLGLSVGLSVLFGVAMGFFGFIPDRRPWSMLSAGFLSGLMSTLAAIGAAPMVLMYQSSPAAERRAALSLLFFIGGVISIFALLVAGQITEPVIALSALLVPAVGIGFIAGMYGPRMHEERVVRAIALVVCGIAGFVVVIRSGYALMVGSSL